MLKEKFSNEMIDVLTEGFYNYKLNPFLCNKAHQYKSEDRVHTIFKDTPVGKILKKTALAGEALTVYMRANEIEELEYQELEDVQLEDVILTLEKNQSKLVLASKEYKDMHEFRESKQPKKFSKEFIDTYTPYFALLNAKYGSKVHSMEKAYYSNGAGESKVVVRVIFKQGLEKVWSLELPLISEFGFFKQGNSEYIFCPMPKNLDSYLSGKDKEMELVHPYEYLVEEMITVFVDDNEVPHYLENKFFERRVAFVKGNGTIRGFQQKIEKILSNSKENSWDESKFSPVIYFDSRKSTLARASFEGIIAIDSKYDTLVEYGIIPGVDLLTGSTSTPGVRCKIAFNYKIVREGHKLVLRKVIGEVGKEELGDFMSDYKFSNAGTFLSSAKRDNSCTSKDTYQLVNPQTYKRRVRIVTAK